MLSVISPILLFLAITLTLINKQWHRLACAIAIVIPTYAHFQYFDLSTGWEYYGSAIGFSILAIALLQMVKPNDRCSELVAHLQIVSLVLASVNLLGYVMWYEFYSPVWYNALVLVLVIAEALRLVVHTDGDKIDGTDGIYYNRAVSYSRNRMGGN